MELPKLYRKVWIEWEWITDECWDGNHVQNSGFDYHQAYRVLDKGNNWFWKFTNEVPSGYYDDDDRELLAELIVKRPPHYNYFYAFNTPTIKEQTEQKEMMNKPFKFPF